MFANALNTAAKRSESVRWLIASGSVAANETRTFLGIAFSNIRAEKQNSVAARIRDGDAPQIKATIHELVAHELLWRLQLRPVFEPHLKGQTPDLLFEAAGVRFISDVVVKDSPLKTVRHFKDGTSEAWDTADPSESRADKISKALQEKAESYSRLNLPIVPILFLGDSYAHDFWDIETACFGITLGEIALEAAFPQSLPRWRVPVGGLLLPREDLPVPYENLSAVIACYWFYTLNPHNPLKRHNPGKRLACSVLHRWSARQPLPVEAFDCLPQVCWDPTPSGGWSPRFTTEPNLVLKFFDSDQIRVRPYSDSAPW